MTRRLLAVVMCLAIAPAALAAPTVTGGVSGWLGTWWASVVAWLTPATAPTVESKELAAKVPVPPDDPAPSQESAADDGDRGPVIDPDG
jgi:hypothetical protein